MIIRVVMKRGIFIRRMIKMKRRRRKKISGVLERTIEVIISMSRNRKTKTHKKNCSNSGTIRILLVIYTIISKNR